MSRKMTDESGENGQSDTPDLAAQVAELEARLAVTEEYVARIVAHLDPAGSSRTLAPPSWEG